MTGFRRLDAYVLREIRGPLTLGFLVYTFILLIQFLFRSAEMIIRRGVPAAQVGELLLLTLPNIVVLTIPMSFLFAILVAVGRLSGDSELIALRSSGVSLYSICRPIMVLSFLLAGLNTVLMLWALPHGNHRLQQLRIDILTRSASRQVEPRVFYEDWQGMVLYVFEARAEDEGLWRGVFVAEDLPGNENQITFADTGRVNIDDQSGRLLLKLQNALVHKVDFRDPQKYNITRFDRLQRVLVDEYVAQQQSQSTYSKGLREMTVAELRERISDPEAPEEISNLAHAEIHKKFSIPAACVVFGLLALPLGFSKVRGGKSSGFALSAGVIMLYYILLNNGEEAARIGKMAPWLSMWLPNIVLGVLGLFIMERKNRDRGLLLEGIDRWLRSRRWQRPPRDRTRRSGSRPRGGPDLAASRGRADVVLRLPRLRLRFPNLLDRYVARLFFAVLGLVMLSGITLTTVADLSERLDDIIKHDIGPGVIWDYYKYLSLQMGYEIVPVAVLVTTLVVFGLLSKTNEVTAAKALGISLYRLAVPALIAALAVTSVAGFLELRVLAASNERVAQLQNQIRGNPTARTYRRADRQWLFGQGRYIYNYLNYDAAERALHRLQVFEFNDDGDLTRRLFSSRASYIGDAWLFDRGWVRSFDGQTMLDYQTFDEPAIDHYPESPDYFESEYKLPKAMSYAELKDYLREIEASGQAAPELEVALARKVSYPFLSVVMALVALPFSFRLGRRGTLYGVGIGVILGMIFYAMFAFASTLGETGALPAMVAVWSPSLVFIVLSLYLLLGVRS